MVGRVYSAKWKHKRNCKKHEKICLEPLWKNIKGQWFRPTKNKQGFAMSGKKVA